MYTAQQLAELLSVSPSEVETILGYKEYYTEDDANTLTNALTSGTKKRKTRSVSSKKKEAQSNQKPGAQNPNPASGTTLNNAIAIKGALGGVELFRQEMAMQMATYKELKMYTQAGQLHPDPQLQAVQLETLGQIVQETQQEMESFFSEGEDGTINLKPVETITSDQVGASLSSIFNRESGLQLMASKTKLMLNSAD